MSADIDDMDRSLLALLQADATTSYAALGQAVGLSPASAHERVRKLRARGVVRRTTIEVDPAAVGRPSLAFVLVSSTRWMGGQDTAAALRAVPEVEEAHIVAGTASVLVKVRARDNAGLQTVLRQLFEIPGVASTDTVVVLETIFERSVDVGTGLPGAAADDGEGTGR